MSTGGQNNVNKIILTQMDKILTNDKHIGGQNNTNTPTEKMI